MAVLSFLILSAAKDPLLIQGILRFAQDLEQPWDFHPPGHGSQLTLHLLVNFSGGLVHCCDDEVLQHFHIVRIDRFLVDGDAQQLLVAVHRGSDHAAAGASFDAKLGHALLHLLLHLLDLFHQLLRVHFDLLDSTTSPPRCFWKALRTGSSRSGDASFGAPALAAVCTTMDVGAPNTSRAMVSSASRPPVTASAE